MPQNWGSWTAYTPAIDALVAATTDPVLGSGATVEGFYQQDGLHVVGFATFIFGSSGVNAGSGWYCPTLPVPARGDRAQMIGQGYLLDASDDNNSRLVMVASNPGVLGDGEHCMLVLDAGKFSTGTNPVSNSVPWTWAASDQIRFRFDYEAATS